MTDLWAALITFVLICLSALGARFIRPRLPETHRTRETIETMSLMIGMLVTFAALVLGLLTASVKSGYDSAERGRHAYALQLTQLDRCLRDFGPAADAARADIRSYTAAVIASTWPHETPPAGVDFPDVTRMPLVGANPTLAGLMDRAGQEIRRLDPPDAFHAHIAEDCRAFYLDVLAARLVVIEDSFATLSLPFYSILVFWLMVIFAAFGLAAPPNTLSLIAILLCAVSLSSAIFVISDLSHPYGGMFSISSVDMRRALELMMAN
jgi:hypothetical protein